MGAGALAITILASTAAQLLLKTGVSLSAAALPGAALAPADDWAPLALGLAGYPGLWWILGGLACYGVSLLAWLQVLARLPLSVAYPLLSLSYVLVYAGAILSPRLAEALTPARAAGVLLVAAGAALVSASHRPAGQPSAGSR